MQELIVGLRPVINYAKSNTDKPVPQLDGIDSIALREEIDSALINKLVYYGSIRYYVLKIVDGISSVEDAL